MIFDTRIRRLAGGTSLVTLAGAIGVGTLAATHPTAAAAALAQASSIACALTTACSSSTNTSSGQGFYGYSVSGSGLEGASNAKYGVNGHSNTGFAGVAGYTPGRVGVYGYTTGGQSGTGVQGFSPVGIGVVGSTSSGVYGVFGQAPAGIGAGGSSSSGIGVNGSSSGGPGVHAASVNGTALEAISDNSYAVNAQANATAVLAKSFSANGADVTGSYIGLIGRASSYPLVLTDTSGNNLLYVDSAGSVYLRGSFHNFARTQGGATVTSFSPKTTLPTVEDTGTAELAGGAAVVRLDPVFGASIDARSGYRVFVTPHGDTRGLFVPVTTPTGFIVREAQGGRSTVSFDYRIVATALGQAGQRMAVTTAAAPRATLQVVSQMKSAPPAMQQKLP